MHRLIGLSGGADSVYLLLRALEEGGEITAVHVNHGLRGENSDGDETFVRQLCAEKNVPLLVYRATPPENPSEAWAREARYGFFRQAMKETGAEALLLAHHRDDQTETLLMHLLRGAGLKGLSAMAADTMVEGLHILRPLLSMSRADIRRELQKRGQIWREDESNQDTRYLRNAIRQEILPRLEALSPGAGGRIAQTACLLREDAETLDGLAEAALGEERSAYLPMELLKGQPDAMLSRILRLWVERISPPWQEWSLSLTQTRELMTLLEAPAGSKINLPGGRQLYRGWTHLHLLGAFRPKLTYALTQEPYAGDHGDGKRSQSMPASLLRECILRSRQTGDYIRPFGSQGRQSLQDYLVNRHIDAPFRDEIPLLCRGSEVVWVCGVGAGEAVRGTLDEERILVRLECEMPWARK